MILLIRNIPRDTYYKEMKALVEPVVKGGLLQKTGDLKSLEIIALQEENVVSLEFQALLNVEPETVAARILKQLHGTFLRGHRIMVREYVVRNPLNDRRKQSVVDPNFQEKRDHEDRRRNLKVFKVATPVFQ